jgi:activator of HSP90 ATPase
MKEQVKHRPIFNVEPSTLYNAWLDSQLHSQMINSDAECTSVVGGDFSTWDGYITGKNLELIENIKIVQSWRTTEFDDTDEDSHLSIELTKVPKGTELKLIHINIPKGQTQYEQGWVDNYFVPMASFFKG